MNSESKRLNEIGKEVSKGLADGIIAGERRQMQCERLAMTFKNACKAFDDAWNEHFLIGKPMPRKEEFFIGEYLYKAGCRIIDDDHQKQSACFLFGCQEGDRIKLLGALELIGILMQAVNQAQHDASVQYMSNPITTRKQNEIDTAYFRGTGGALAAVVRILVELKKKYERELRGTDKEATEARTCRNCKNLSDIGGACKNCVTSTDPFTGKLNPPSHWQPKESEGL